MANPSKTIYYPLADELSLAEVEQLGIPRAMIRAIRTDEFRPPLAGEWYISGAIPEAYRASNDYGPTSQYHICKLVQFGKAN